MTFNIYIPIDRLTSLDGKSRSPISKYRIHLEMVDIPARQASVSGHVENRKYRFFSSFHFEILAKSS